MVFDFQFWYPNEIAGDFFYDKKSDDHQWRDINERDPQLMFDVLEVYFDLSKPKNSSSLIGYD